MLTSITIPHHADTLFEEGRRNDPLLCRNGMSRAEYGQAFWRPTSETRPFMSAGKVWAAALFVAGVALGLAMGVAL